MLTENTTMNHAKFLPKSHTLTDICKFITIVGGMVLMWTKIKSEKGEAMWFKQMNDMISF